MREKAIFYPVLALAVTLLCFPNASAQTKAGGKKQPAQQKGTCADGSLPDPVKGCPPKGGSSSREGGNSKSKLCTISVSLGIDSPGIFVQISKVKKNPKDTENIQLQTNEQGEVEFTGLNCSGKYVITPQPDEKSNYTFGPSSLPFGPKLRPREIAKFTAKSRKPPPPPPPPVIPCKSVPAKDLGVILHSAPYSAEEKLTTRSSCNPVTKNYYNEYRFTTLIEGHAFAITISSPDSPTLDLELYYGTQSISCSQSSSDQNSRTLQCEMPRAGEYALRVGGKKPDVGYTLGVKNNGLTDVGYKEQIERIRLSLAGDKSAGLRTVFDAVNQQISTYRYKKQEWGRKDKDIAPPPPTDPQVSAARGSLEEARSNLESLEKADPTRTMTYTLLAVIYRAVGGNYDDAQRHALSNDGDVRFRVRLSENDKDESRFRYWLLIRKGSIAFERLESNVDGKLLAEDFSQVDRARPINKDTEVEIRTSKGSKRYITPISKDTNEAKEIGDFLNRYVVKEK